jgi:hypothetical protein
MNSTPETKFVFNATFPTVLLAMVQKLAHFAMNWLGTHWMPLVNAISVGTAVFLATRLTANSAKKEWFTMVIKRSVFAFLEPTNQISV